jgi:molecular chaperone GrpE
VIEPDDSGRAAEAEPVPVTGAGSALDPEPEPEPGAAAAPELDGAGPEVEDAGEAGAAEAEDGLARLESERDHYIEALQRLKAEFENFRKRTERERRAESRRAAGELLRDLLPVLDNLERAVDAAEDADPSVTVGFEMVRAQLEGLLQVHGVTEVPASAGERFDPEVHEAVHSVPSGDHDAGAVISVLERGYRFEDGALLRAARVVVASPPSAGA